MIAWISSCELYEGDSFLAMDHLERDQPATSTLQVNENECNLQIFLKACLPWASRAAFVTVTAGCPFASKFDGEDTPL